VPAAVIGDPGRLRQILLNLISNAVKFTHAGEVGVEIVVAEQTPDEVMLKCTVRDTGIGVPEEKRWEIFGAFVQADTSTTRKYGGTGLGLTISSQLVEMMGGRLWLESEPGTGSRFNFVARFDVFKGETVPAPSFDLRSLRVLVVDDNATNRAILTEILDSWQMSAAAADSAPSALAILQVAAERGQPFQLVLTDAAMPDVDGFSLAEQISSVYRAGAPKVILLTSAGAPALRGRRVKLFAATLVKPVKQSDLLDTIVTAFAAPATARRSRAKQSPRRTRDGRTGLRVLVAEDNATNQKLVSAMLDQQGHLATVVGNGRLAAERAAQDAFDLILMDVQMPEMSGLEATAAIRKQEEGTGRHVPIVALTARAMAGDREQCLAAGMDAYVAKPVRASELFSAIEAAMAGTPWSVRPERSPDATASSVNVAGLLSGFGGRSDLVAEVIDVFLTDAPEMLTRLRHAVSGANASELAAAAHAIKGAAGLFSQGEAYERARDLEIRARSGDAHDSAGACADIEASVSRLGSELRAVRDRLQKA